MRAYSPSSHRSGFTLVELLVVIAIIGILIGLLLPAVQAAREAARRAQCSNHLKQWATAAINYETIFQSMPASRFGGPVNNGALYQQDTGWMVALLPYVEQQSLYDLYEDRTFTFAPINAQVTFFNVPINSCPSADQPAEFSSVSDRFGGSAVQGTGFRTGDYAGNGGFIEGGNSFQMGGTRKAGAVPTLMAGVTERKLRIASFRDGLSNTLFMWDSVGARWYYEPNGGRMTGTWADWMAAENPSLVIDENRGIAFPASADSVGYFAGWAGVNSFPVRLWDNTGVNWGPAGNRILNVTNAYRSPYALHPNMVVTAFGDGSVRNIVESVDNTAFLAAVTRNGGEAIPAPGQ